MSMLTDLQKRLSMLESVNANTMVRLVMPDGSRKFVKDAKIRDLCSKALDGYSTPEIESLLMSVSNNAEHKLIQLLQMVMD